MSVRDEAALVVQKPVVAMLAKYRERIAAVVPKFMDDTRVLKLISGEIQRNPKLLECTPVSVLNCVVQAASLGLEIRQKVCYLVPLKDGRTGKMTCNLWLDYRGEIDLIKRSGDATSVNALVVYSKDKFEYFVDDGGVHLRHYPLKFRRVGEENVSVSQAERGTPIGAYMIAALKDGTQIDYMSLDEIEQRRKISKNQGPDSPWVKHWDEQACKTVIHHGAKMLRQTPELVQAQEIGDRVERGESPEYIIDVDPEDVDMAQPFLPAGSTEAQDAVLQQKLSTGVRPAEAVHDAGPGIGPASEDAPISPEESRRLDEKAMEEQQRENARIAAANQPKPTPKVRFGPQRQS